MSGSARAASTTGRKSFPRRIEVEDDLVAALRLIGSAHPGIQRDAGLVGEKDQGLGVLGAPPR